MGDWHNLKNRMVKEKQKLLLNKTVQVLNTALNVHMSVIVFSSSVVEILSQIVNTKLTDMYL